MKNQDWRVYADPAQRLTPESPAFERWLAPKNIPPWRRPGRAFSERDDRVEAQAPLFTTNDDSAARDLRRAEGYVPTGRTVEQERINLALLLRRPLLVRGPPGIGKSTLAYHIALCMGLGRPLRWEVNSRTTLAEGLYQYDAVGHLGRREGGNAAIEDFITLGPLGTALLPTAAPRVLLVDELDKASYDLPNDLLHVFEEGGFEIPELRQTTGDGTVRIAGTSERARTTHGMVQVHHHPVVVITSNDEREYSAAFQRRCVELELEVPNSADFARIVERWWANEPAAARGAARRGAEEMAKAMVKGGAWHEQPTDRLLQALFLRTASGAPVAATEALRLEPKTRR